ncbi:MAG: hypothetical protein AAFQ66_08700 [Pseudomonadota bacterium]
MRFATTIVTATAGVVLSAGLASAACEPGKPGFELTAEEASEVYTCLEASLLEGYQKGGKRWIPDEYVAEFRNWTKVSTAPAAPGFHSNRFLVTWVNETGAAAYSEYREDPEIPAGTLIAKESFSVDDDGIVQPGPLFFMEKVAEGTSPETMDWYYMLVGANGAPLGINVMAACNDCHVNTFGHQGGLGYPVEEARLK